MEDKIGSTLDWGTVINVALIPGIFVSVWAASTEQQWLAGLILVLFALIYFIYWWGGEFPDVHKGYYASNFGIIFFTLLVLGIYELILFWQKTSAKRAEVQSQYRSPTVAM